MKISLPIRILFTTLVIFALPLLIYFLVVFYQSFNMRYEEVVVQLKHLGENRALLLSQSERFSIRMSDVIEQLIVGEDLSPKELNNFFEHVAKGGDFHSVFLIQKQPDGKYMAIASSDVEIIGEDFSGQNFIEAVETKGRTSFLDFDEISFLRLLWVVRRVPQGILVITTPVTNLLDRLISGGPEPYAVNFSLVDTRNVIFASSNPNLVLKTVAEEGQVLTLTEDSKEYFAVKTPIKGTPLFLLVDVDKQRALGHRLDRLRDVLLVFFALVIIGAGIAIWITHRMSKPLRKLTKVMHQVSGGDFSVRYPKYVGGFEINQIGAIFNETIQSLSENIQKAETERVHRETLSRELQIGKEIQLSILPQKPPAFPGVEIAARYLPAKEVGGDFYDAFVRGDDLVLTVADASGKGVSACLYSLSLRGMLRSASIAYEDHATILKKANNLFCQDTGSTGMFVTAFVAIYHPKTQSLTYTSAGHSPAFLLRQNGTLERLEVGGLPLGIQEADYVEGACTSLKPGDLLFIYSDGITEAHNPNDELYGEERLTTYLRKSFGKSPEALVDDLLDQVTAFHGPLPQYDDITLLATRWS